MISLVREKEKALELRRMGWTYNEILKELPVAKSSLSLWLKDLPLTDREKDYLKSRRDSNISRGRIKAAASNRANRLEREKLVVKQAELEFEKRRWDPLFLVGIALYWAEGAKRSSTFQFMNSDPEMIQVFLEWLGKHEGISKERLKFRLFMHRIYDHENCGQYWMNYLGISEKQLKVTFKPTEALVKRRPNYKGCLRIEVPQSTRLLLKMKVWQNMLARKYMRP